MKKKTYKKVVIEKDGKVHEVTESAFNTIYRSAGYKLVAPKQPAQAEPKPKKGT